ncbi:MAG: rhomboid family intramembrane serine protease [Bacteroidota bacterium]|nr:rhomboid family intramembrane serine protease [Bacteroidota bacterium]
MLTLIIIAITAVVSILCFQNQDLFMRLRFSPYLVKNKNQTYRFFTHAFVHADWAHLLINMFVLLSFGKIVEQYFGMVFERKATVYYIILYLGGILFSSLPSYWKHQHNPSYSSIGASGAVSAVLFSSILFSPLSGIYIMFIPIPIPAFVFGILYLAYEAYSSKRASDNIGHDAHFWGAMYGVVITLILNVDIGIRFIEQVRNVFS